MIQGIWSNLKFELNIRRKSLSTYIYFSMFFALGVLIALAMGGAFSNATVGFGFSNKIFINSSLALTATIGLLSSFSLFIIAPAFGQAIVKDFENKFDQIIYSSPVNRKYLLISRFISAYIYMFLILSSIGLGLYVSSTLPYLLSSSVTANHFINYVTPYLTIVIPNLFIFGSIFFLIAGLTKKMTPVYILTIIIFMGWMLSTSMTSEVENKLLASLLDPFGITATLETAKYWSVHDQNTKPLFLESFLLYNRLFWVAIAFISIFISIFTFNLKQKKIKSKNLKLNSSLPEKNIELKLPQSKNLNQGIFDWSVFLSVIKFEFKQAFKSTYFLSIVFAGICYMFVAGQQVGKMYGTNTFPVTYMILDFVGTSFDLFLIIIVVFLSGEIIWRDRDVKIQQIVDATPTPNITIFVAKIISLLSIIAVLLLTVVLSGITIQALSGYTHFQIDLYFKHLYGVRFIGYINIIALAFFFQIVFNNKYIAHGCMVLYYLFYIWADSLGLEHKIYNFNSSPSVKYSDMNGYGHLLPGYFLFKTYWLSLSVVLLVVGLLYWQRGNISDSKNRNKEALRRLNLKNKSVLVGFSLLFLILGGTVFYNTNILNSYSIKNDFDLLSLKYESKYSELKYSPQLSIVSVIAKVDLFPSKLAAHFEYQFTLKNKTKDTIDQIFINASSKFDKNTKYKIEFNVPVKIKTDDSELGVLIYTFEKPILPNTEIQISYTANIERKGVPNSNETHQINYNGTFFNNSWNNISVGYSLDREITDSKTREKFKLAKKDRIPKITDSKERQFNVLARDASWINFEATVSTDLDQIAVTPGYLVKSWEENNRKYFHYKMDQKILNFYSFLSAKYQVKRDLWKDVNIEIFYHPEHSYNVDKMIEASKDTLDYFSQNYGPYQFKQYRILEFPRYASFAQSFPNTVPFSENIGFIAKVDPNNPKDVDYPYFVTAHEFAHQYWGHQIIPATTQGAFFPTESFAEFTALLVLEKKYGHEKMKRFFRYELERYLWGRSQEKEYESPLILSEGQMYIHYQKGSLALFALKEYLGIETVNSAIKEYLNKVKFQEPPYTVATEFLEILKNKIPKDKLGLVEDYLEKIVLFDNRPTSAAFSQKPDKTYDVILKVTANKFIADGNGKEIATDFEQDFDIGIMDDKNEFIYLKKHKIKNGENEIKINVASLPTKAGIDPLSYIIDKTPDDNMIQITK
jgi:ABC-2 type transport system permease protein